MKSAIRGVMFNITIFEEKNETFTHNIFMQKFAYKQFKYILGREAKRRHIRK